MNKIIVEKLGDGISISRQSKRGGFVNLGFNFTAKEVSIIKVWVKDANRRGVYLTYDQAWKPMMRKLGKRS